MEGKFLWVLCMVLAVSTAKSTLREDLEELKILVNESDNIEPFIFENKILKAINALKDLLQNGDPEEGIPPSDPFFLSYQDFDFIIRDTAIKGYLQNATFANFSRFEPVNVRLKVLPLSFTLEIFLDQLHIDGRYELVGKFFDKIPVNGTGKFTSEIKNVTLTLNVRPTVENSSLQIKDLNMEYKVLSLKINYTNELVDDKVYELDEDLALYVLDKIQEKYMPLLLNLLKKVVNHLLLGLSFSEILQMILEFLKKPRILA